MLWPRTIEGLENLPHESDYVFECMSHFMAAPTANAVQKYWRALRTAAGVSNKVKFADLRDAAQTAAAEAGVPIEQVRVLAGQRTAGVTDHYVKRRPRLV